MYSKILIIILLAFSAPFTVYAEIVQPIQEENKKEIFTTLKKQEEEEKILKRIYNTEHQRNFDYSRNTTEMSIDYFFDTKVSSCTNGMCFGVFPFPLIYTQSKVSNIQFLGGTTGNKTAFIVRIKF